LGLLFLVVNELLEVYGDDLLNKMRDWWFLSKTKMGKVMKNERNLCCSYEFFFDEFHFSLSSRMGGIYVK
jgi:hypothetical protein